jgi:hypothetical protein
LRAELLERLLLVGIDQQRQAGSLGLHPADLSRNVYEINMPQPTPR